MPKQTTNMVLKDLESKGYVELVPLPEDKRNKQIRFTEAGKQYADSILSELRNAEFAVIEKMGLERIRRLNEDSELFIRLFRELGTDRSDEHKQTGCTDILSVCPPVDFSFALSGIYSIVDGYFIGNRLGMRGFLL